MAEEAEALVAPGKVALVVTVAPGKEVLVAIVSPERVAVVATAVEVVPLVATSRESRGSSRPALPLIRVRTLTTRRSPPFRWGLPRSRSTEPAGTLDLPGACFLEALAVW